MNGRLTSSLGRAFQRTGAWWVNDLFVILSREETAGRVSVIEAEERVDVLDWTCKRLRRYEGLRDWSVYR